jgi:hypothetical protein
LIFMIQNRKTMLGDGGRLFANAVDASPQCHGDRERLSIRRSHLGLRAVLGYQVTLYIASSISTSQGLTARGLFYLSIFVIKDRTHFPLRGR